MQERHRLHYSSIWNLKASWSLPTSTLDFVRVTRISNLAGNTVVSVIQIPWGWGVCISGEIILCIEGSRTGYHQASPHSMPRHAFRLTCDEHSIYSLLLSCLFRCCQETVDESAGCSWNDIPWFLCRDSCLEVCLSRWPHYNYWNSLICIKLGICVLYGIECVCQSNWSFDSFWDIHWWIILQLTYFQSRICSLQKVPIRLGCIKTGHLPVTQCLNKHSTEKCRHRCHFWKSFDWISSRVCLVFYSCSCF